MKIYELQKRIVDALNGVEELIQGGCKAIVEDSMTVIADVQKQLQTVKGVTMVVMTPSLTRNGSAANGIPTEAQLSIQCIEIPELNRRQSSHLTALDAACVAAYALDSSNISFSRISQSANPSTGAITVTADFNCTFTLT